MVPRAQQDRSFFRNRYARLFHGCFEVGRHNLGLGWNVPEIEADAFHIAIFEWILVDRCPALSEVAGSIDVRAAMVGHGDEHHAVALNVTRFGKRLLVGLPDAMNDGRLSRIGRGAVIELPA